MRKLTLLLVALLISTGAQGKVLFEGFYKLEIKSTHAGYLIIRHSVDEKRQQRTFTYYQLMQSGDAVTQSGVKTVSTLSFEPLSYVSWWSPNDGKFFHTEGEFRSGHLKSTSYAGLQSDNEHVTKVQDLPVPKDAIFSSLVSHVQAKSTPYAVGQRRGFVGLK